MSAGTGIPTDYYITTNDQGKIAMQQCNTTLPIHSINKRIKELGSIQKDLDYILSVLKTEKSERF